MANFTKSWRAEVGLNHTPAYQGKWKAIRYWFC